MNKGIKTGPYDEEQEDDGALNKEIAMEQTGNKKQ